MEENWKEVLEMEELALSSEIWELEEKGESWELWVGRPEESKDLGLWEWSELGTEEEP